MMRAQSYTFTRAALGMILTVAAGLPVLLLITTTWPHTVVALADLLAVAALVVMYATAFQAGYRERDEIAMAVAAEGGATLHVLEYPQGERNA